MGIGLYPPFFSVLTPYNAVRSSISAIYTAMPRSKINLSPYKDEIVVLLLLKKSNAQIREYFNETYGLLLSDHTLRRRLKEWDISIRKWTQDTPALRDRVISLFFNGLNDRQLYSALENEGYVLSEAALVRL